MSKRFHIGTVLTITHGALMGDPAAGHPIDGVYKILNFMTGDNLYTHQLPRVSRECGPRLLEQHPQLAEWVNDVNPENYRARLADAVKQFGEFLDVEPMPKDAHEFIDPMSELAEKIHPDRIITVRT